MHPLRLRVRLLARRPSDDDAEGEHLASLVRSAVERGAAAPIAVVIRAERTELIELRPVVEAGVPLPMFVAGLTRSEPEGFGLPLAVGLAGRFRAWTPTGGAPVALAFLEWPDCRWWQWRAVVDAAGRLVPDSETRHRAVDGDGLAGGLGRWWSAGRRRGNVVRFSLPDPPAVQVSSLVH
jgi:hypothetical protein